MSLAIKLSGLTKEYGGKLALDGVDLEVPEGSVFGFLGANGAGKTTTLRILTGLARASSGEVRVFGRDVVSAPNEVRADIGFLPDVPGYYDWMTASELLHFAGHLFGLGGNILDQRVEALLDLTGLAGVHTKIGGYSRGMKQRLGVAQALINAPKLLLLDEPTSALDPIGRKQVLEMIASLGGRTTVFFSTHILSDVERVCDTVAILHEGRVVTQGCIEDLKRRYSTSKLLVGVTAGAEAIAKQLSAEPWATDVVQGENGLIEILVADLAEARRAVPAAIAGAGVGLTRFESGEISLEEVFVDLVGGEG